MSESWGSLQVYGQEWTNRWGAPDASEACTLLCCSCGGAKPDEWINWQKCFCQPDKIDPDGNHVILAYASELASETHQTSVLLQSRAPYLAQNPRMEAQGTEWEPNDETGYFWWFFLCEQCRENPYEGLDDDALAPIYLRKNEIVMLDVVDRKGRKMRNQRKRPVLCEEVSWFEPFGSPPRDIYGRGNYWSPPNSPSLAPIPGPLIEDFLEFLLSRGIPAPPLGEPDADTNTAADDHR
jgi:hypothetical protein